MYMSEQSNIAQNIPYEISDAIQMDSIPIKTMYVDAA
jgi:hypothetical protein